MTDTSTTSEPPHAPLKREIGVCGAVMMGLGSIIGTGVFVSIGIAAGAAGPAVVLAIALAAVVAACNGLSSAQLAANHPLSGGTYEYGYRWLHPALGFTAGWMFLCAKSASAATAALGFAGYALSVTGDGHETRLVPLAVAVVVLLTAIVATGIRRSNATNIAIVSVTLFSLAAFVLAGLPTALARGMENWVPFFGGADNPPRAGGGLGRLGGFLEACALMFVAYTGYGRIATLGEEIREPRRNIPRAIVVTLLATMAFYVAVGFVAVAAVGAERLSAVGTERAAPLEVAARAFHLPAVAAIVSIGAVAAMLGVLLNLILGLSRVMLSMGRRGDMPGLFAGVRESTGTPLPAVLAVGLAIAGLALVGDVRTTWSFSAFTVLVYYAITNLAAIRLSDSERLYPRWIAWAGLCSCGFLAFWVEPRIWMVGLGMIAAGLIWHGVATRLRGRVT
ncbi:MAG: APC family permease [Planctomycetaceae bacterium]